MNIGILLIASGIFSWSPFHAFPADDDNCRVFKNTYDAGLEIGNPRNAGRRLGGGTMLYGVDGIIFVQMADGKTYCPLRVSKHFFPGGGSQMQLSKPTLRLAAPATSIDTPNDPKIDKIIFFVKGTDEETGWRVYETKPKQVGNKGNAELGAIKDLLDLPKVEESAEMKKLWSKYEAAQAKFKAYPGPKEST